jgi:hypothetical protein
VLLALATTLWDYIYRAMPQDAPGSLSPNAVYAVTAFLLHSNDIIPRETVMSAEHCPASKCLLVIAPWPTIGSSIKRCVDGHTRETLHPSL